MLLVILYLAQDTYTMKSRVKHTLIGYDTYILCVSAFPRCCHVLFYRVLSLSMSWAILWNVLLCGSSLELTRKIHR